METIETLADIRRSAREFAPLVAQGIELDWGDSAQLLHTSIPHLDLPVTLHLTAAGEEIELTAFSEDDYTARLLRNSLIGLSELRSKPQEHHLLASLQGDPRTVLATLAGWAQHITAAIGTMESISAGDISPPPHTTLAYWWDSRANFGDAAGPWLIRAMTGQAVVNSRFTQARGRALGSIGSLFQMLNRSQTDMWGSGILYPPTDAQVRKLKKLKGIRIHAVRGPKTRAVLQEKLGWNVPEIYGDPALLFPRYFQPTTPRAEERIAFVPHKHHWKYFKQDLSGQINKLSVADDVETVVAAIATAGACISTSLHGIIFAQAYGVPWVWLNVQDDELKGGEFKFEDFFATLDANAVARHDVSVHDLKDLDLKSVAARATLPELKIDLNALEAAFPLARPGRATPFPAPVFRWSEVAGEDRAVAVSRVAYRKQRRLRSAIASRLKIH